jgi:hypothetical protein
MLAAVLLPVLLAGATELDAAKKAYADVDYGRCRDRARAALLVPATRPERVDAYRLLGLCAAAESDTDDAREAFRLMLAIDRDARLPDGLSPRFTSSFREAKGSWVGVEPLRLSVESEIVNDAGRVVRVRVHDEAELVARLTWRGGGGNHPPVKRADVVEFDLAAGVDVVVVALDKAGGEVAVLELPARKVEEATPLDPTPKATVAEEDRPFPWLVVGGVAGGVLVVGAVAAVTAVVLTPPRSVTLKPEVVFAP